MGGRSGGAHSRARRPARSAARARRCEGRRSSDSPRRAGASHAPLLERLAPRKLLVFRALRLGDLLCAVPALRALRARLPQAEIALVGLPSARGFAERFAHYIDRFLEFSGHPALPELRCSEAALERFLADVRRERADL